MAFRPLSDLGLHVPSATRCRICDVDLSVKGSTVVEFFAGVPDREMVVCETCAAPISRLLGFPEDFHEF